MRFNRQSIAALSLPAGKAYIIYWDETFPGFGLRVNPTGKVWVVQYRVGGKSRRETLGKIGVVPLDEAREVARKILARVQLGADPRAERAKLRACAALTLGSVVDRYLSYSKPRLRQGSYEEVERHLVRHWAPLRDRPIGEIKRSEVATRLEELGRTSGPIASNRARAALSALFTYAMGMGLAEANPVVGTIKVGTETARERVLSDAELAAIWRFCGDTDYGRIVRLLMLLGQRRDEIADMRWSEVDLDQRVWTIPQERTKNGVAHTVPLTDDTVKVLSGTPRRINRDLVFGAGSGGFSGWSQSKKRLDERLDAAGANVRPWRLHDLRRTVATRMGDLGVQPHVVEAILNHLSGFRAGVAGVYNRALYAEEKRDAVTLWSARLNLIVGVDPCDPPSDETC